MSKNGKRMSGPFDEFLGQAGTGNDTYNVNYERPSRVWFEKADGETISVAYVRITLMRYDGKDVVLSLGEHVIRIEGERLKPLYEALHEERATKVRERGQDSLAEFEVAQQLNVSGDDTTAIVHQLSWDSALYVEG